MEPVRLASLVYLSRLQYCYWWNIPDAGIGKCSLYNGSASSFPERFFK